MNSAERSKRENAFGNHIEIEEGFSQVFVVFALIGSYLPLKFCPRNDHEDHSDDKEDNKQQSLHCFLLLWSITGSQALRYYALLPGAIPWGPFSRPAGTELPSEPSAY